MNHQEIIEYAKNRFSDGPIGTWSVPSSSPFSQFAIVFHPNGEGTIEFSEMDSPTEGPYIVKHAFTWRSLGPCRIEIECVINENERDDRIIEYEFIVETGSYCLELVICEQGLPQVPNTLFYLHPPTPAWSTEEPDDELESMLDIETD